jgi:hypothetical protein
MYIRFPSPFFRGEILPRGEEQGWGANMSRFEKAFSLRKNLHYYLRVFFLK